MILTGAEIRSTEEALSDTLLNMQEHPSLGVLKNKVWWHFPHVKLSI